MIYKKKTSIVQCVSIIKEVINDYVNQNSCVYMCMLDASKAFDRVNLLVLFLKLYAKGLVPHIDVFNGFVQRTCEYTLHV